LEALGFDWDPVDTLWEEMCKLLVAYKKHHGDCNVPRSWRQNEHLAKWVDKIRHRKAQLSPNRIKQLDGLGFDWDPHNTYWEQMYERLAAYKKQHGHCNVPREWKQDQLLSTWVTNQRHRKVELSPERIRRLETLGFDWDPHNTYWGQMYAQLVAFQKRHKHCNVPQKSEQNPGLGPWVNTQRTRKAQLSPNRIKQLDALGFDWDPASTYWEQMYERLIAYK
jgi:hypothetical protein